MDPNNKYTKMQQNQYDNEASAWSLDNKDPVVGSFDKHNAWKDYDDFLFKSVDTAGKLALDFGCGPARNIVKFADRFQRIDGVDISDINLENGKKWLSTNNMAAPTLFKNNGIDLSDIANDSYDVVFSTICMQHICVYDIRFGFWKEFYRVLKTGGKICIQMGYGLGHFQSVDYYDNNYEAQLTNSGCDTRVESPEQLQKDLESIGFSEFDYNIRPTGPGDIHGNWIFFRATK